MKGHSFSFAIGQCALPADVQRLTFTFGTIPSIQLVIKDVHALNMIFHWKWMLFCSKLACIEYEMHLMWCFNFILEFFHFNFSEIWALDMFITWWQKKVLNFLRIRIVSWISGVCLWEFLVGTFLTLCGTSLTSGYYLYSLSLQKSILAC